MVVLREPKQGTPSLTDTIEAFEQACADIAATHGHLAIDAERASGFRYGQDDYLIQCKRGNGTIYLFDIPALQSKGVQWELFNRAANDAVWILHDARQDLPGFAALGIAPHELFDTEVAAQLLGLHRCNLAFVTEHYLHVSLAKEHSAADWSYRPLPRDWRNYAALDVELLDELRRHLEQDLKDHGKLEWATEEFSYLLSEFCCVRPTIEDAWRRLSNVTTFNKDRYGLSIAKELFEKRDSLARQYNIAPSLLLSDETIIKVARIKPRNLKQFQQIPELHVRIRVRTGSNRDAMFERYAPIQRRVKPKVWYETIHNALSKKKSELPTLSVYNSDMNGQTVTDDVDGHAPRSLAAWKQRHPERYERLQKARHVVSQIAQDVHMSSQLIVQPNIIRDLCWSSHIETVDISEFLRERGARSWQINLISESLSRVIM